MRTYNIEGTKIISHFGKTDYEIPRLAKWFVMALTLFFFIEWTFAEPVRTIVMIGLVVAWLVLLTINFIK